METLRTTTAAFTFDRKHMSLVAEASSLGLRPGVFPSRLEITSTKTGRTVTFEPDLQAEIENEGWDGELKEYRLFCCHIFDKTIRARRVVILND